MTQPAVSSGGAELYAAVRQWHATDALFQWAGLLFCEAIAGAGGLSKVLDLTRDTDAGPGWSQLMDVTRCPSEDLPYLAQFRGIQLPGGLTDAQQRDMIVNQPAAARGRPATLIAAVQMTLSGSQHVELVERDTSPYHATIKVYQVQLVDEAATKAAIAANKPGMLIVDLQILTGPTYDQTKTPLPASPDYADRESYFPTYEDVQVYVP